MVADPVRARVSLGEVDILSTMFPDARDLRIASNIGGMLNERPCLATDAPTIASARR